MKKTRVYCKLAGITMDDYGLFSKKFADGELMVPDELWFQYVEARHEMEVLEYAISKIKMKKFKK